MTVDRKWGTERAILSLRQTFWFSLEWCAVIVESPFPLSTAAFLTPLRTIGDIGFVY